MIKILLYIFRRYIFFEKNKYIIIIYETTKKAN